MAKTMASIMANISVSMAWRNNQWRKLSYRGALKAFNGVSARKWQHRITMALYLA